jgi:L-rhamnose isomerase
VSSDEIRDGFYCVLDPMRDGRYEVWIKEKPYRGIETDAALKNWERIKVSTGCYTEGHFVGSFWTKRGSLIAASRALRKAQRNRRRYNAQVRVSKGNLGRERILLHEDQL